MRSASMAFWPRLFELFDLLLPRERLLLWADDLAVVVLAVVASFFEGVVAPKAGAAKHSNPHRKTSSQLRVVVEPPILTIT